MEPAPKRPRVHDEGGGAVHMTSEPSAFESGPAHSAAPNVPAATASGASAPTMLRTIEDVMAALPRTPTVGAAAAPLDPLPLSETLPLPLPSAVAAEKPAAANHSLSPAYPNKFLAGPSSQRCRASFSSEPPSLDLGASSIFFESPALMPVSVGATTHIPTIESLPGLADWPGRLAGAASSSMTADFNPFSRRNTPRSSSFGGAPGGGFGVAPSVSEPVEGGILMLADIEESHASRVALHSAWRDYGQQLVTNEPIGATAGIGVGLRCESCDAAAPSLALQEGARDGPRDASLSSSGSRDDLDAAEGRSQLHALGGSAGGILRRPLPSDGDSMLHDTRGGNELLDDAVAMLATHAGPASSNGLTPYEAEADEGEAEAESDEEEDESSGWVDEASGLPLREIRDERVRHAVRSEMQAGGLSLHTVASLAGVAQPMLCAWLGAKQPKAGNAASHNVLKLKLLGWMATRGVVLSAAPHAAPPLISVAPNGESGPVSPATIVTMPRPGALAPGGGGGAKAKPVARQMSREGGRGASAEGEGGAEANKGESSLSKVKGGSSKSGGNKEGNSAGKGDESTKKGESAAGGNGKKSKAKIKLTPQHLYVAYVWYLKQREARGEGLVPGEEESFCLKCKDGGDVLLCDYSGCTKSYHPACANLKTVPEGIWECPRHRCVQCGSGPSQTDVHGRPRRPDPPGEAGCTLWACRTCPTTYCERCLPKEVTFAGVEIVCESCQELLSADMASLQRDLIKWKPELFADAASADV